MSSVLANDMDAYQRAFETYKRRAQSYNGSIMKDANGNTYLFGTNYVSSGGGQIDEAGFPVYGSSPNAVNPQGFYAKGVAPQAYDPNPQVANKTTGVVGSTRDNPTGYVGLTNTDDGRYALARTRAQTYKPVTLEGITQIGGKYYYGDNQLDPSKVEIKALPKARPRDAQLYTATYQAPDTFVEKPETFTMQAPEGTQAQGRRMTQGGLADQERGLIGEVMASKGIKY